MTALKGWVAPDPEQSVAIYAPDGLICLSAGAGTGKTTTLVQRAIVLAARGVPQDRILVSTFSRHAAQELTNRLKAVGITKARVGTIHSVANDIFQSATPAFRFDDKNLLMGLARELVERRFKAQRLFDGASFRSLVSLAKGFCLPADPDVIDIYRDQIATWAEDLIGSDEAAEQFTKIYEAYEEERVARKLVDYDDMLVGAWLALARNTAFRAQWAQRFVHLLLDEMQDTSKVQWAIVQFLTEGYGNLFCVGSPEQAMYGFRAAVLEEFVAHAQRPDVSLITLRRNYRSGPTICDRASDVVSGTAWNLSGRLVATRPETEQSPIQVGSFDDPEDEAASVVAEISRLHSAGHALKEIAVLYRMHAIATATEIALIRAGIPMHTLSGGSFWEKREVAGLLAYLRIASLRDATGDAVKVAVNCPFRYIGKRSIADAEVYAQTHDLSLLDALRNIDGLGQKQRMEIADFHALLLQLNRGIVAGRKPKALLLDVVARTAYLKPFKKEFTSEALSGEDSRAQNVHEVIRLSAHYDSVAEFLDFVDTAVQSARAKTRRQNLEAVQLSTIHSAKGLEWDTVFVVGANDGVMPMLSNPDPDEELRVFHVAVTRPRHRLYLSCTRRIATTKGVIDAAPSPFIARAGLPQPGATNT